MSHFANDEFQEAKAEAKEENQAELETKGRTLGVGGRYGRPLLDQSNIPHGSYPDNNNF